MDTNNPPKVSIVMPTYNGEKYIKKAIESCLHQTYKSIELIVVDDGSTDNTAKFAKGVGDSRLKFIRLKQNSGLAVALNKGFTLSTGEYLTWTSDDNLYESKAIETMVNHLGKYKEVDFVYANYYRTNENGEITECMFVEPPHRLVEHNCIGPCFMYRRRVYERIGNYNPEPFLTEDYEYWIRIFKSGLEMVPIDKFLYRYRLHPGSKTGRYGADTPFEQAMHIRDRYFKGYRFKKFFISRFNILRGKFIWRREWLRKRHPLIVRPLSFLKDEFHKFG